jgi:hypothetical protein
VPDAAVLVVAVAVAYLPGLVLLIAFGVRWPLLLAALAPTASVALAGAVGIACAVIGVEYGPVALAVPVALLAVVAALGLLRRRRSRATAADARGGGRQRLPVALILGIVMTVVGVGYAGWTWLQGLGGLATPPQEHDMIIHAMQTAYIARTGMAAPWQLVPADVLTGTPVAFYPSGFHLLAGVVADLTGDVVTALNAMTVVVLAGVLCVGVAALGAVAARQLGMGQGSAALTGGIAALVMAGAYRPAFHLMHDGGILGNAAALTMVPGVVAGILALAWVRWQAGIGVGIAAAGVVWVHPSAAVSVGVTVIAWWAGQVVSPAGRRQFRAALVPLAATAAAGVVLVVPAVAPGLGAAGRTGDFPPDTAPLSFRDAVGTTFGFPYSGWIDQAQSQSQVWIAFLLVLGVGTVIALRRGLGPVVAWAVWSLIVVAAWLSPGTGIEAPITGFFYHAMLRTWSHIYLIAPVLCGLGVVIVANRVAVLLRRRTPVRARWTAPALAAAAFVLYAVGPAAGYTVINERAVANRYSTPDFVRVGADDQRAIDWLASRVERGERVFNSPNDGSTYLYVEAGIPVVNVYTLGLPGVPYSYRLLEDFNTYPTDESVRRQLADLDVRWVYVDSSAPGIGSAGSPEGWAGNDGFSLAPGLENLDGLPGLQEVFRSGTVSVYSLDLAQVAAWP